jgi:hypothetical protein
MPNLKIVKVWTFASDSNPNKKYETLQYENGSTSCNCMGWTRKVAADGTRTCKHTRLVHQGIADSECLATTSYQAEMPDFNKIPSMIQLPTKGKKKAKGGNITAARRKFNFD